MKDQEIQQLLQRYQAGQATPAEAAAVEQWYDALTHDEPLTLSAPERQQLQATLWQRIATRTVTAPQFRPRRRVAAWARWMAAAVVLTAGGVGTYALLNPQQLPGSGVVATAPVPTAVQEEAATETAAAAWTETANPTNQSLRLTLPDGTTVALTPASRLRYPAVFTGAKRQVYLRGEAFFDVTHNAARPFQVFTDQVVTTVLGTSFTVRAEAGQSGALVQVHTGRVRVTPRARLLKTAEESEGVVLLPNQQTRFEPTAALVKELVPAPAVLAAEQSFIFNDRPVAEVLRALEQAYGVTIVYDETVLTHCTVSLTLREPSLYEKLDLLCKTLGATYQVDGTQIRFKARPCSKT